MSGTFADDFRELMEVHDKLILVANAVIPDNPELAEVVAHDLLSKALNVSFFRHRSEEEMTYNVFVIHEPSCDRGERSCTCLMYVINPAVDPVQTSTLLGAIGVFTLTPAERDDLLTNDSIGG